LRTIEIARLEPGAIDTAGRVHDYGVVPDVRVPSVLARPAHTVRRYDGVVHLPKAPLAYHGRSVLPDSFRWHLTPEPVVPALRNVDDHFGRLMLKDPGERLEGSYFHLVYGPPGHFGHLMTEAVAKLWGWWPAKEADPDLKILVRRRNPTGDPGPESRLLPAFGIAPDDIVWVDGPVSVTSLVGCTPMWHNAPPFYAHPAIRETWARLRAGLVGDGQVDTAAPRIFVTRRQFNRPCSNVDEVERFFADRGYAIVAPEELSFAEQVATFAGARVVAGFGGAGMFNLAYAERLETVIVLNQSAYHARNELLYAAVHGADLHTFWSSPDHQHPPGGYSPLAHQSSWTFDLELNGAQLDRLLARLVQ
jgi:capsular polysaccharide biosynthesis protein